MKDQHSRLVDEAVRDNVLKTVKVREPVSEAVKIKRMEAKTAFTAFLVQRGVSQDVARDWWKYRDGKPMTEAAWKHHCQQADKAGISSREAAAYAAGKKWRVFYAEGYWHHKTEFRRKV